MSNTIITELKRRNVFKVGVAYTVLAWIVVQVTAAAVPAFNMPEWMNTVVFFLGLIGFPFAIFFAWAFEITPDGIKKESDIAHEDSIAAHSGNISNFIIFGLVTCILGYFIYEYHIKDVDKTIVIQESVTEAGFKKEAIQKPLSASIAVLPFVDMSIDKNQQYFSDGISEEILNVLVRVGALKVVSRTSSFQFKDRDLGIPEIAKQLNVRFVLEGSVRKSGETLRITAQLIDTQNDHHLWSETYDRPLTIDNVFVIQDEISHSIVKALAAEIGLKEKNQFTSVKLTNNLSAYELFLKARPLFQSRSKLNEVNILLNQAVEQDSKFSEAWAILAANQGLMVEYGYSNVPKEDADALTFEYAERALAIDANNGTAIATLAKVRMWANIERRNQYDWFEIITDLQKVLDIEPNNPQALNWLGHAYNFIGMLDLALENFEICATNEPFYVPCQGNKVALSATVYGDTLAFQLFQNNLNRGVIKLQHAPFPSLSRMNKEWLFKAFTNQPLLLSGWRQHDELYEAYQNPTADHKQLIKDLQSYIAKQRNLDHAILDGLLTVIGAYDLNPAMYWDEIYKNYRQSKGFKARMKATGVYKYWIEHAFPDQCRPLPNNDFVCD